MTNDRKPDSFQSLIDRSSIGEGLRRIREHGIDAELVELEQESGAVATRQRRGRPARTGMPTPAGRAALLPRPMTEAEIYGPGGLVERTRASTEPHRIESGRRTRERWERHRAARGVR